MLFPLTWLAWLRQETTWYSSTRPIGLTTKPMATTHPRQTPTTWPTLKATTTYTLISQQANLLLKLRGRFSVRTSWMAALIITIGSQVEFRVLLSHWRIVRVKLYRPLRTCKDTSTPPLLAPRGPVMTSMVSQINVRWTRVSAVSHSTLPQCSKHRPPSLIRINSSATLTQSKLRVRWAQISNKITALFRKTMVRPSIRRFWQCLWKRAARKRTSTSR